MPRTLLVAFLSLLSSHRALLAALLSPHSSHLTPLAALLLATKYIPIATKYIPTATTPTWIGTRHSCFEREQLHHGDFSGFPSNCSVPYKDSES